MPRKGMRSIFFHPSNNSSSSSSPYSSSPHRTFSETMIDETIANAEEIIKKWDPESSAFAKITSLFYENRREAREFLRSVKELQQTMQSLISLNSSSLKLVHAQTLMQTAMKRLEKEFYQILAANRDHLDPESVSGRSSTTTRSSISDYEDDVGSEDEIQLAGNSIAEVEQVSSLAMTDLRLIADCMTSSGYGKECVKIYTIMRKSIVDEGLYRLGFERMSFQQLQKLNWEKMEHRIKNWVNATKIAVKTLFSGERILCDHVFASSDKIKESCFSEIAREAAINLFAFPESVVKCKTSPEKMFRILDMYGCIAEHWPEIESIFSYESTTAVRSQAIAALIKLGDAVRIMLSEFESAIQKDKSKSPIPRGGIHPLTRYVMNYISFLADYSPILADIFADYPLQIRTPLPEPFSFESSSDNPLFSISSRLAWLILVLLCKLDRKAELYKDVGLSYLFLANNLQYVLTKVSTSDMRLLLGEEWFSRHEDKLRQYTSSYEKMAWSKVMNSLPPNPTAEISLQAAKEVFRSFNSAFEQAHKKQSSWVVPDGKLRDEIKVSVSEKIRPAYRSFYLKYRPLLKDERNVETLVRFSPEDLDNYLSDLFYGNGSSGSASSSVHSTVSSVTSSPVHPRRSR